MTKEERQIKEYQLKQLQALPLDIKILKTKQRIREFYNGTGGNVYLSFSGGKDSTVLLDLVRKEFPDVIAVYCDTGLEYPELKEFVKKQTNAVIIKPKKTFVQVIEEYGFPIINKDVSMTIEYAKKGKLWAINRLKGLEADGSFRENSFKKRYKKYEYLIDSPFKISSKCCDIMKKRPFKLYEKENKVSPIVGTIAEESKLRRDAWIKNGCNAFDSKRNISQPLSFWTEQDILTYIKENNLEIASVYGELEEVKGKLKFSGCQRTGCMFCALGVHLEKGKNRFEKMKETHPKIYDYCINKLGLKEVLDFIGVKY
jgi:3'-phosphoadenosine 5'-phosphosulfate sulfotransferase (PAPS reductase)/FAD synthetase